LIPEFTDPLSCGFANIYGIGLDFLPSSFEHVPEYVF
jgi:hypothetical protein